MVSVDRVILRASGQIQQQTSRRLLLLQLDDQSKAEWKIALT